MENLDQIPPSEVIIAEINSHRLVLKQKLKHIYENFCLNVDIPIEERWKVFKECFNLSYADYWDGNVKEHIILEYKHEILCD